MIPLRDDIVTRVNIKDLPSKTYKLHYDTDNRVITTTDGLDAIKQAVYKILQTERYRYLIYSWDYGIELEDLYGQPIPYIYAELERRITEALLQDNRIKEVTDFDFSNKDEDVTARFKVSTVLGDYIEEVVYGVRETNI